MRTPRQKTVTMPLTIRLLREPALAHRVNKYKPHATENMEDLGKTQRHVPSTSFFASVFPWDHIPSYSHSYECKVNNLYF